MADPMITAIYDSQTKMAGDISLIKDDLSELKAHHLVVTERLGTHMRDVAQHAPLAERPCSTLKTHLNSHAKVNWLLITTIVGVAVPAILGFVYLVSKKF